MKIATNSNFFLFLFLLSIPLSGSTLFIKDSTIAELPFSKYSEVSASITELMENNYFHKAIPLLENSIKEKEGLLSKSSREEDWSDYVSQVILLVQSLEGLDRGKEGKSLLTEVKTKIEDEFGEDHALLAKIYHLLGTYLDMQSKFKDAMELINKSLNINLRLYGEDDLSVAQNYMWLARSINNYEERLPYMEKGLAIAKKILGENHPELAPFYFNFGKIERWNNNYKKGLKYTKKAVELRVDYYGRSHLKTVDYIYRLGKYYRETDEKMKAKEQFQIALATIQTLLPKNDVRIGWITHNLGNISHGQEEFEEALNYYKQTLAIKKANNTSLHTISNSMGWIHLDMGNYEEAVQQFLLSHELTKALYGENYIYIILPLMNAANAYFQDENYEKAAFYYRKAEMLGKKMNKGDHFMVGRTQVGLGKTYFALEDYQKSLNYYQKSMVVHFNGITKDDILKCPPLTEKMYNSYSGYATIQGKAKTLYELYLQTKDDRYLVAADNYFEVIAKTIDVRRQSFDREKDKLKFLKGWASIYELGIDISLSCFEHFEEEDKYLQNAFQYIEKNKSMLLLESIKADEGKLFSNIPQTTIRKEKLLKKQIGKLEKKVANTKLSENALDSLNSILIAEKRAYDELINNLENNYPKYYDYKKNIAVTDLTEVQQFLPNEKTAVLNFHLGKDRMTVFGINKQQVVYNQEVFSTYMKAKLQKFIALNKKYPSYFQEDSAQELKKSIKEYYMLSRDLYQFLLKDVLAELKGVQNLIIIRDKHLSYLPFETLIDQSSEGDKVDFSEFSFLLKRYLISYEPSATLLLDNKLRTGEKEINFVGFAPAYEDFTTEPQTLAHRVEFSPLRFNQPEVEKIARMLDGDIFTENNATEAAFKNYTKDYQVLHFAMHGVIDDTNPNLSHLVFEQKTDGEEDNLLHAYEIYNMNLEVDLAVLSACETAVGKLNSEEGIMSLSRAFKKAGCPSIITSLWKAEDKATSELMINFYEHLKLGVTKDSALSISKLRFLEAAKGTERTHPFFWSNFILIGNNAPINFSTNYWGQYGVLMILTLLGSGLFGFRWFFSKN